MKALCLGKLSYNITNMVDSYPQEGTFTAYKDYVEGSGSFGSNTAYLLGKYNIDTYIGSVVADDSYGNSIKKELEEAAVHTEYMETAYGKKTPIDIITINKNTKVKTVYEIMKEEMSLKKTEFQMSPDIIITDGYDYGATIAALNKYSNKPSIMEINMPTQNALELCKYATYLIVSKEFAETMTGTKFNFDNSQTLINIFSTLINKFPGKQIVIYLDELGVLYVAKNQIKVLPGLKNEIVDKTGSKDFFVAAFAYGLLNNYDIEKTVTFANIVSGLSMNKTGLKDSAISLSDVNELFKQKYPDIPQAPQAPSTPAAPSAPQAPAAPQNPTAPAA